jgi:general secretion pathway protein A
LDHDPYGLTDRPFQLTPDPRFYFESATHRKAMTYLGYGLAQGEGFIVVTGEVGTGKTMLVGRLMATIDRSRLTAINLVSTQLEGDDILRIVALALGVATDAAAKGQLLARIERFLHEQARGGKRTLLIVDEAQNLPISALEELRMLSNFQYGGQALLQIFLLGQPEFREALAQPRFEQLRQRVIATHHLTAMGSDEVAPYIMHRLACAGWKGTPRFTQDAYEAFHRLSGGIPRRLNMLAGRVMLQGAIERLIDIDGEVVEDVAADLASESIMPADGPQPLARAMPITPEEMPPPSAYLEPVQPVAEPEQQWSLAPVAPEPQWTPAPAAPERQWTAVPVAAPEPQWAPSPVVAPPAVQAAPAREPSLPSYTSYAPAEDDDEPAAPPVAAPALAAHAAPVDPFAALPANIPPPSIAQPPRYDGYVPPEAVAPPPPIVPSRPQQRAVEVEPPIAPAPVRAPEPQPMFAPTPQAYVPPVQPVYQPPLAEAPPAVPAQPSAAVAADPAIADYAARNAELEARLAEQEAMLRRTLSLLVELVETDPQLPRDPRPSDPQGSGNGGNQDAA